MISTEHDLVDINTADELMTVLNREGIDTDAFTPEEHTEALEVWRNDRTRYLTPAFAEKEMSNSDTILQLLHHFGNKRSRDITPFCPNCGSTDIYECRPATTYYPVKALRRNEIGVTTIAKEQEHHGASEGEPDLWRCFDCDFETENEIEFLSICLHGGEIEGQVTIESGFRIELLGPLARDPKTRAVATVSCYCPEAPSAWVRVLGDNTERVTLPVTGEDGPLRRETVMRSLANDLRIALEKDGITRSNMAEAVNDNNQVQVGDTLASVELAIATDSYFLNHHK